MKGKVKWYNIKQGFGFIEGENDKDLFFHKSEIPFWSIFLNKGDKVEFLEKTQKKLSDKYKFNITGHMINFYGLCKQCSSGR